MTGLAKTGMWIADKLKSLISRFLLSIIVFYRKCISPLLGGGKCRFYPTCSEYAYEAVKTYGFFYGGILALCRIIRCAPWSEGGYDPLPTPDKVGIRIWLGKIMSFKKGR